MSPDDRPPITETGLHARLIRRLFGGALAIALAVGLLAGYVELEQTDDSMVDNVKQEADLFAERIAARLPISADRPDPTLEADLMAFLIGRQHVPEGHFLIAELYDAETRKAAEAVPKDSEWLERALKRSAHQFPTDDSPWYDKFLFKRRLFIQALTPLRGAGPDRPLLGYFEGVYEVSVERMRDIVLRVGTTALGAILVVLATAALLYPIILGLNRGLFDLTQRLVTANIASLEVLGSAIAKRDSDTHAHNFRVTLYAIRLAEAIGLKAQAIRELIKGAFLHDVGKIAIPDAVLLKPGKLDDDEFALMKTHVEHGLDIVRQSEWLQDAADVVRHHHEKYDGTGYPGGIGGTAIPAIARIFAIVDVFDALTSRRPYKEPLGLDDTLAVLRRDAGRHFDPDLVETFLRLAPALHAAHGGREDGTAEREARSLIAGYFKVD
ncbi:MAG: HD domain-containing protein [Rhodospirillales bacterium]|nr:HD domain-containing protein [Rhodospirillales bacterium]